MNIVEWLAIKKGSGLIVFKIGPAIYIRFLIDSSTPFFTKELTLSLGR
jgi:hypothetical protein